MKYFIYILLAVLISSSFAIGQNFDRFSVPFYNDEGDKMLYPTTGGLNLPQYYNADLNNDSIIDLVILDREGDIVLPFLATNLNGDTKYEYKPEFAASFYAAREWFILRDYNNDGVADMFHFPLSNKPGIEVQKGFYENDTLKFEIVSLNEIRNEPEDSNMIPILVDTNYTQIYVSSTDQPEIIDIDRDGDLDILTFDIGGAYLNYYKNYSLEKGLGLDTFSFELEDECWGKFFELEASETVYLSDDIDRCANLNDSLFLNLSKRHAGSCVTAFDSDGDTDFDLLIGDLASSNILFLENEPVGEVALIVDQEVKYPINDTPIDIVLFVATFFVDINGDGNRDLMAAPNSSANIENYNVGWYYENIGTDASPQFEFRQKDAFVEDMLDYGSDSSVGFIDANADGLLDLVIGTAGVYTGNANDDARLIYYENTGTVTSPEFTFRDDDFASYAQFQSFSFYFSPAFGDLDGDGDIDMIVGDRRGDLYYSENIAGEGNPVEFKQPIYRYFNINPGTIVRPTIVDLDQDGLGDIVTGEKNNASDGMGKIGALAYYRNIGTIGSPNFDNDLTSGVNQIALGGVNTQTIIDPAAYSSPSFIELEDDYLLVVGSYNGQLRFYNNILNNINGQFEEVFFPGSVMDFGARSTPVLVDINGDGFMDLASGNSRGGISLYKSDIIIKKEVSVSNTNENSELRIIPNPNNGKFKLVLNSKKPINTFEIRLVTRLGQEVFIDKYQEGEWMTINNLTQGVYILIYENDSIFGSKKLMIF